jgi:small subunit ribosomal protein SAe
MYKLLTFTYDDIKKLLLCNAHLGKKTCNNLMKIYIWKKRKDGIFIINISKTLQKINLAARAIVAIKSPIDVIAISNEDISQRATIKFAQYTGCQVIVGRWISGKFTNQSCKKFSEPQLIILTDPKANAQPLKESSFVNIPTIAFCNTEAELKFVDIVIPGNNINKHSVALLWWMLTREVLRMRGVISRTNEWDIPIDLFISQNI